MLFESTGIIAAFVFVGTGDPASSLGGRVDGIYKVVWFFLGGK